ncbi:hypothetical protein K450DRAFT_201281 [Umbelopsis ramanniana AG]|uniref:Uncharacterized protein n=1 Tax=Umbelopsis ramanniana AG TaxID=1314678 RepID=A0AAD5E4M9_UMBRA|nr:uncharacterized protein K450DRAFT_201281 [Umbelopsis ramanniana AG]KAI8577311.1 hypothetical protein K450DRAFT_201281 [Umbelopsis ramanniana AG]
MILGILKNQLKADHLSTALKASCPIVNRDADDLLLDLHKSWLADKNQKTELMVNDLKNTINKAYDEVEQEPSQSELKRPRPWTVRELSILHALYPILDHDYDSYTSIIPERTAAQIATKIQTEYARGYLGDHQANDHYKQTKAIQYEVFHDTASQMGLLKDRQPNRQASKVNESEPAVQIPAPFATDESAPNGSTLTEPSSSAAIKLPRRAGRGKKSELVAAEDERIGLTEPRRVGRSRKSDMATAQKEKMTTTVNTSPRRMGRPRKSDLADAQGKGSNATAPRHRVGRPRKSELADAPKEGREGIESRRVGRPRNYEHFDQPEEHTQSIDTTSLSPVDSTRKFESDGSEQERWSELTSPRRGGHFKRIEGGKIKKAETLPISSHSRKTTAGKKPTTASSTPASSPGTQSPPNSSCLAS